MVLRFFLFVGALLFVSCTDVERDSPYDPESRYYIGVSSSSKLGGSSSSAVPSSSSARNPSSYCVYPETRSCFSGSYYSCPAGGELGDFCPYSSSAVASSSSQIGRSSSSSEASPEYNYCVFISDRLCLAGPMSTCPPGGALSNSCPYGSSSSAAVSSSSSRLSSSSVATYTVTYNAGTGVTVPANQTKTQNVALTLSTAVPTRTGYAFAGWNTSADGSGMSYASGASYVDNASITLYAQWTANTYTVTYNANNGTGAPANQTKTHDAALTLSAAVPTRTGYAFASWNTSNDGSGASYASGASYTANAGVTLYAQWYQAGPSVSYGGETYKSVVIGSQTWMARNLNYNVEGSKCYDNKESYCDTYGRFYDWVTAMALPSSCYESSCSSQINAKHKGICPTGWHIPSYAEWTTLTDFVGGSPTAGTKLKAMSGWSNNGNGTDAYGFAALPGGLGFSNGNFVNVGGTGIWWSANEDDIKGAYGRYMDYRNEGVDMYYNGFDKYDLHSIRCVQD